MYISPLSYVASLQSAIVGAPMNSPIATTLATDGKSLKFTIPAGFNIGNYTLTILSTTGSLRSSAVSFTIVTPSKKPFAWYTDENVALCWSAGTYETSNGCSVGHGLTYPSPNALNAGTVIGAKEYCAGLNSGDGRIWRLPNTQELMAGLDSTYGGDGVAATGQPGGFQAGKFYWTDTSFAITGGDANRMFIMSGSAGQSGASQQNILKNATAGSVQFASFPGVYARCVTGDYSAPVVTPTSAVSVSSPSVTYSALVANSSNSSTTQQFTYNFSLTAGNNPIYISKTVSSIFSVQGTAPVGLSMNPVVFSSNSVSTGDTSTYYYIAAGQTRAFSSTYQAMGTSGMVGNLYPLSIYYGTSSTAPMGNSLSLDTTLQNSLKAVVFH